jgi:hypothetical protein
VLAIVPRYSDIETVNRSLRFNIGAAFLGMLWLCVPIGAPLPLLMQVVEASSTQLGLLSASWQAAMLVQIPAALFSESLRRRKVFWAAACIPHRILWGAPALIPILLPEKRTQWPIWIIASLSLSNIFANLGTASWSSWMADIVPTETAGAFWSIRQRAVSAGLIVGTAWYGWILDHQSAPESMRGFQWVFLLCAVFGVCDILVHLFVDEPAPARVANGVPWSERLRAPFQTPGFGALTLAMAFWTGAQSLVGYTLALPGFFSMVHLHTSFGANYSQASYLFISAALGAAVFSHKLGSWMDKAGAGTVMQKLVFWAPISLLTWWLAVPGEAVWFGHKFPIAVGWMTVTGLVQGGLYVGTLLCQFRLTQIYMPNHGRTVAMALHWSLAGFGGAIGAFSGGWLKGTIESAGMPAFLGGRYPYDVLVLLHLVVAWCCVLPLCRKMALSERASAQ